MSAPYFSWQSFEACPECRDSEECWYWGCCLAKKSQAEKEKMEGDLSLSITRSVKFPPEPIYPGPYRPGDSMPDGRNMAALERERREHRTKN